MLIYIELAFYHNIIYRGCAGQVLSITKWAKLNQALCRASQFIYFSRFVKCNAYTSNSYYPRHSPRKLPKNELTKDRVVQSLVYVSAPPPVRLSVLLLLNLIETNLHSNTQVRNEAILTGSLIFAILFGGRTIHELTSLIFHDSFLMRW